MDFRMIPEWIPVPGERITIETGSLITVDDSDKLNDRDFFLPGPKPHPAVALLSKPNRRDRRYGYIVCVALLGPPFRWGWTVLLNIEKGWIDGDHR